MSKPATSSAVVALVISTTLALSVMISHAKALIKVALCFNIAASAVFAVASLFVSPFAALWGVMLLGFTAYYAYVVWGRIPFAAANLSTATTAVRGNLGLAHFAYGNLFVMTGWSAWWLVTFVSTVYVTSECSAEGCAKEDNGLVVFLLLLSYYWTYQVLKNIVHVTVSGTVGTWWFVPSDAASCCSHAVRDSYLRSVTTSFGSICFGSLLVAIIQAMKQMVRRLRGTLSSTWGVSPIQRLLSPRYSLASSIVQKKAKTVEVFCFAWQSVCSPALQT